MADQTAASLRVRVTADIADIKQGLAVVRGQVASLSAAGSAPASRKNPIKDLGDDAVSTSRVLAVLQPQITDIVTSLQGGMSFTTVALQQGGQIRDVAAQMGFGIKDIGKALLGLVTPTTLTVAAVAALGYAWYQASEQAIAFEKSIQSTGNRAGLTAVEIGQFASEAARATNSSAGAANEAALAVAATGRVTANAFRDTTIAVLNTAELTGQSVDSIAEKFAALQGDPVKAMMKLDESLNFVTLDLYQQVKALQDQGDAHAAAGVVAKAAADATSEALDKVDAKLNWLQRGLKDVKAAASEWLLSMKNAIGLASQAEELQVLQRRRASDQATLDKASAAGLDTSKGLLASTQERVKSDTARINEILKQGAKDRADAEIKAEAQAAQRVAIAQDEMIDSQASNATKRANEIKKVQDENLRARLALMLEGSKKSVAAADQIAKNEAEQIAAINKKYADKKTPSTANASRNLGLQQFEDAADVEKARVEAQTKVLQAQYQARGISASEYYAKLRALTVEGTDAQAGALEKEIAYLKARTDTGKDSIATTQKIGELEAKLATVRSEGAAKVAVLDEQETALKKQREDAIRTYKEGLDQQTQALQSEMDAMVAHVGAGDREYEIRQRIAQIYAKQAGELKRLADARVQAGKDTEKLSAIDQQEADLRANTEQQVSALIDGYQRLATAQGEWSNGAKAAWANYLDDVRNVAGAVRDALTSAFKGGEDAFVQFVKTGKLSFSSLADSIIEDMARIAYRQAASGIGSWLSSLFGGYSAPSASFASGFGNNTGWLSSGQMGGYASGGYTGDGGKFDPAGIVHKGEGVVPQWGIAAMGGPAAFMGFLGTLRSGRGYADGGVAGIAAAARTGATAPKVEINIENNSNSQLSAQAGDVKFDGEKWVIKIVAADIASGGAVAAAGKGRFGWKDQL